MGGTVSSPPPGSATPDAITNYAGTAALEGGSGLLAGFPTRRTLEPGVNNGQQQSVYTSSASTFANYRYRIGQGDTAWGASSGTITGLTYDGQPYSWSDPTATLHVELYSPNQPNSLDGQTVPSLLRDVDDPLHRPPCGHSATSAATVGFLAVADSPGPSQSVSGNVVTITQTFAQSTQPNIVLRITYANPNFSSARHCNGRSPTWRSSRPSPAAYCRHTGRRMRWTTTSSPAG